MQGPCFFVSKQATAGVFVDPGTELFVVSDVSRLWMLADVYAALEPLSREAMLRPLTPPASAPAGAARSTPAWFRRRFRCSGP